MAELHIGDEVLNAGGTYSKVYSFGHFAPKMKMEYLQVRTASMMDKKHALEISSEHLIYIQDKKSKTSIRRLVAAGDLKVGDHLWTETGLSSVILSIRKVQGEGAYAPLTTTGDILVNGIMASNYVTRGWLKMQIPGDALHYLQHGATLPVRLLCSLMNCAEEIYDDTTGYSSWVSFWFRIEQWQLALSPVVRIIFLGFLAAPAVLIMLLGKFLSMPMSFKVIHLIVAFAGFLIKRDRRAKPLKPDKSNVHE